MNKDLQDKAFAVLPKEFKKDVKDTYCEYSKLISTSAKVTDRVKGYIGAQTELELLFGKHNLTSDTEEEEMLTVSRRKVIAAYLYAKEMFDTEVKTGIEDISLDRLAGIMYAIERLFGSVCLSEEVASKPKFKVGDKVKILSDGQTGYIMSIDKNLYYIVYNNFAKIIGGVFTDSEIEPYTGPQSKHEEKRIYPTDVEYRRVTSSKTIICDKKQALTFYEHLLDLVEKERMSKNFSEWCKLEREYIALIGKEHFTKYFTSN